VPGEGVFWASVHHLNLSLQAKLVKEKGDKYPALQDGLHKSLGVAIVYAAEWKEVECLAERFQKDMPSRAVDAYHTRVNSKMRNPIMRNSQFQYSNLYACHWLCPLKHLVYLGRCKSDVR